MVAFAVAAEVEDFVLDEVAAGTVEAEDGVGETLPLGFLAREVIEGVDGVGAVDEAEVCG